jgi:general secretion pathway protein H
MKRLRRQFGFTLIELLIALVIMVAVAAVAAPRFSRAMTYVELRKSTQHFAASLRDARNRSISGAEVAEIIFDTEQQFLRVRGEGVVYAWPEEIEVRLEGVDDFAEQTAWSINFYPDGSATNAAFIVSAFERSYRVSVDWLTGRVKVI